MKSWSNWTSGKYRLRVTEGPANLPRLDDTLRAHPLNDALVPLNYGKKPNYLAIEQLLPQLKQAVQLRFLEGWSQQEVADFLGYARRTITQRAACGLQGLKKVMAAS